MGYVQCLMVQAARPTCADGNSAAFETAVAGPPRLL